ncbi:DUF2635 domain-containing protein [Escherichia albertii]|uniref:DUF2635 domain-containing protein n=1 Tax=Escherichia albertii TaxID=208962 RepID=UPI000BF3D240|nr:DUF2635 domain-containing protein [Escherichia albertii]PFF95391.1 hypothetical protein CRH02_15290 [Escherichia albertii]
MTLKIKPAEGKAIRDPFTMKLLNPDGEEKPRNSFWIRRLAAGDVVEVGRTENTTGDTDAAPKKRSKSK